MPLSDLVQVNISTAAVAPTLQSFGVPLILGACANALTAFGTALMKTYSSLAGMVADSFATTDPEYLAAQAIWSQSPQLPTVVIGRRTNLPTPVHKWTILTAVVGQTYSVMINGVLKSYTAITSDTTTLVAAGLAAAIGTPSGFGAATNTGAVITITASSAGKWCRVGCVNPNVDYDYKQSHVDAGIATDLANILNVDGGISWYTVTSTFQGNAEVIALAAYVETIGKLYIADTGDSLILGSGTSDLATTLITSAYVRTGVFYHPDSGAFLGAAAIGKALTLQPGKGIWKILPLSGVAASVFTTAQTGNMGNKHVTWFYSLGGVNITSTGKLGSTPSGQWIDTVRDRDWLASTIQTDFFNALLSPPGAVNPANPNAAVPALGKIPYDDTGIALMDTVLKGSLEKGVTQGVLAASPAPSTNPPLVASIGPSTKISRDLTIPWAAVVSGAIQSLTINGGLSF